MTKKKKRSKESRQLSYAFKPSGKPLSKAELNEMLKKAVEHTSLAHRLDEPPEENE